MAVCQRTGPRRVQPVGTLPAWWEKFDLGYFFDADKIEPGNPFTFLADFLDEADLVWAEGRDARRRSGMWIEEDADGTRYHFSAEALTLRGRPLLFVRWLGEEGEEFERALRSVREQRLEGAYEAQRDEELKAELLKAKNRAEALSDAKSTFLANMSHEIRTPMNAVIGLTEVLLSSNPRHDQAEYLELIAESGESLLQIINDILDLSKIEAGKVEIEVEAFDLERLVGDLIGTLAVRAHAKGIELNYLMDAEVPTVVEGDSLRLRQVLVNLIGNALKFTDRGEVVLALTRDDQGRVRFGIRDTGGGIPEDRQKQIFEAFSQADGSIARKHGGTGLGLSISARLVGLMGGHLDLTSELGVGSDFHFSIPLREAELVEAPPTESLQTIPGRVLIADACRTSRRALEQILSAAGSEVQSCDSLDNAAPLLETALDSGTPFDLLIASEAAPSRLKLAEARRLGTEYRSKGLSVLVCLSTDERTHVSNWVDLDLGPYLIKPVTRRKLVRALNAPTRDEGGDYSQVMEAAVDDAPLRVLLAEDNAVNQLLAVTLLERAGHSVLVVGTGGEAVSAHATGQFDVILMDVQMPEMDGMTATGHIRRREALEGGHMPIVALTAHAMKGDRERCIEAGMDGYLSKPIRPEELFQALDKVREMAPRNGAQ